MFGIKFIRIDLIFSDRIEADYLSFNSGSVVEIGIAGQKAVIIQNVSKQ